MVPRDYGLFAKNEEHHNIIIVIIIASLLCDALATNE